jgi:hypothetical protein
VELLDELVMLDSTACVDVATILVSAGSAAVLMGADTGPGEEAGDSCSSIEIDVEDKVATVVLMLVGLMLSVRTEATIEIAAEG